MFQLQGWYLLLWSGGVAVFAVSAALIAHKLFFSAAERFAARTTTTLDGYVVEHTRRPSRLLLPLVAVVLVIRVFPLPAILEGGVAHLLTLGIIACAGWLVLAVIGALEDTISDKYAIDNADNLTARRIQTQIKVLHRIVAVIISILTVAVMLMTFPSVRQFGQTLFASAGIAGLVLGLAAQSTISNLLAGLQVALTQPIRLDDVVIVENEWGRIEEIGTTYVVVRIWDQRRLIVPLSHFIQKPFQNWTRQTSEILGTVFLYVDYSVPVEDVRAELHRCLQESKLWDGRVWNLQVTNASDRSVELRALMSASDASLAWDLRCLVREYLVAFLQKNYPSSLPRMRADVQATPLAAKAS
ncbi:MAG: mechanosensitive ion channel family protein [Candidatus Korobacteraceae bacterium]